LSQPANTTTKKPDGPSLKDARAQREAEALRDNLRRRKQQARARQASKKDDSKAT
jgi:hypothetical protein